MDKENTVKIHVIAQILKNQKIVIYVKQPRIPFILVISIISIIVLNVDLVQCSNSNRNNYSRHTQQQAYATAGTTKT